MRAVFIFVATALGIKLAAGHASLRANVHARDVCIDCHTDAFPPGPPSGGGRGGSQIRWTDQCTELAAVSAMPFQCAKLNVPLDYTRLDSENLTLTLVRVDAVKKPARGSIIFNPGGPGGSGVQTVIANAKSWLILTGGHYNLLGELMLTISRGVNNTLPFSCDIPGDTCKTMSPACPLANASDVAIGQRFAASGVRSLRCLDRTQDTGSLLGTAFVARDMVRIIDALNEDGLLRYYGFSWGTILGATFAAMFPDRVDKMVLDGNVNVHEYYSGWEVQSPINMDDTYDAIFSGCVVAPTVCPLAELYSKTKQIQSVVDDFLAMLKYNPIPYISGGGIQIATYSKVKTAIVLALYSPSNWPRLTQGFIEMLSGNVTGFFDIASSWYAGPEDGDDDISAAITCGEQAFRAESVQGLKPLLGAMSASSKFGGLDFGTDNAFACSTWKQKAKEIYSGNFRVKPRSPILFVGNTYDPVTPLASALNTSAGFGGSVVLQHNGYGHCSIAQPSSCTAKAIRAYFDEGILPPAGAVCQPNAPLYPGDSRVGDWTNLSDRTVPEAIRQDSEDELALLGAVSEIAGTILPWLRKYHFRSL
ncbi:hypothetical protein PV08_00803 [Exophiala spinifera]|uniref:Uncharacterized protein n=1 Tax=Exophiala spinifera TaxID=91928 RepID=A0A0D2BMQ9_9EURO|nr:uncharacterized protein PV08_00803 [Exophiala spinifera]KIW20228.1 hypothetical protein PV08_00803 [Exophiala spinifera]